jgi:hypothetical protein
MYRFDVEATPAISLRLKVAISTRGHFSVYGLKPLPFSVRSRWFESLSLRHINHLILKQLRL